MVRRGFQVLLLWLLVWGGETRAQASLSPGDRLPNFAVEDLQGREVRLRSFAGRPLLIFYEDRTTAVWNRALKERLAGMARRRELVPGLVVLPIVDLRAFQAWPARPIAQSQLRSRARELGKPLWADWRGEVAIALGVTGPGPAVVLLADQRQRVLWVGRGRLSPGEVSALLAAIRSLQPDEPPRPEPVPLGENGPEQEGTAEPSEGAPPTVDSPSARPADAVRDEVEPAKEVLPWEVPWPPFTIPIPAPLPGGPLRWGQPPPPL